MGARHILPPRCPCPQETYVNFIAPPDPAAVRVLFRTTRGNVTRVIVSYPDNYLHVRVPSGVWTRASAPLPSALYALPFIGAILDQRYPRDGAVVLRIRLSSTHTCASPSHDIPNTPCVDGIVQG